MYKFIKKGGIIIAIGETAESEILYNWNNMIFRFATTIYHYGSGYKAWERSLNLMSKKLIQTEELITHKIPLRDWRKGFELLDNKEAVKVLMYPEDM